MRRILTWLTAHGYVLAVLAIALSTALFMPGRSDFAKGQWALLYLLIVVLVAGASGTGPAILAAVLAFLAWNFFFLPPYYTLEVHDAKDWLALVAFLAVGIIMGIQTGRMREREARALARERESALLSRLSASLVSETSGEAMADTVLSETVKFTGAGSAAIFVPHDGSGLHALSAFPSARHEEDEEIVRQAARAFVGNRALGLPGEDSAPTAADGALYLPLATASRVEGVMWVGGRPDRRPYDNDDQRLLTSLANLVAAFLERQHLEEAATRANVLREADRLKASLLSSVSHELKTPLAALTATASNLLEGDVSWDEQSVRDELRAIVDDVARLNSGIGSLLDLSRLEARAWEPLREAYDLADVAATVVSTLPPHQRERIAVLLPDDLPSVYVDFVQWVRVLQNLVENALLYAGESSPVRIGARARGTEVWMCVEDEGPGVDPDEHERIFEKFYRSPGLGVKAPSGTGLGLAITREIVRAHGGRIWVEDAVPHGARFMIALPDGSETAER